VEDVEGARQEMTARGVRFITEVETWEGEAYALFLGPEEKLFEIQRPVRKYSKTITRLLDFSGGGVVMQNLTEAQLFFSLVMKMPYARSDASSGFAHFELPAGHLFEVFGPNNNWGRLTPYATIAFEVEEVGQARRELEAKGVEFVGDRVVTDSGEAFTYFRGPDGYLYKLRKTSFGSRPNRRLNPAN
jgi:catechol 2,3-dioxygenase-like lactoylglutathione lyase family enzyme